MNHLGHGNLGPGAMGGAVLPRYLNACSPTPGQDSGKREFLH